MNMIFVFVVFITGLIFADSSLNSLSKLFTSSYCAYISMFMDINVSIMYKLYSNFYKINLYDMNISCYQKVTLHSRNSLKRLFTKCLSEKNYFISPWAISFFSFRIQKFKLEAIIRIFHLYVVEIKEIHAENNCKNSSSTFFKIPLFPLQHLSRIVYLSNIIYLNSATITELYVSNIKNKTLKAY